jgi:streptomycin 6-kinase
LAGLPALVREWEQRWSLVVGPAFVPLTYNYVASAVRRDGTPAVLKLGVPRDEARTEIAALRLFDGRGAARVLEAEPDRGALLLERLEPGTPLFELEDDEAATSIAAEVMRELWRPLPAGYPFPTVADWAGGFSRLRARFDGGTGPLPPALVAEAESLYAELLASAATPVLLHGDLHHWNTLDAGGAWRAIDPKGVAGEPVYEAGAWLRNPMPQLLSHPDAGRLLARRMAQLADELGFDRQRIHGWAVAQAVLSAWWGIEDHDGSGKPWIAFAELLAAVTP